jgi:Mg2+ and Co2+ transporter CorA
MEHMDIISLLLQTIQNLAVILILCGMLIAFLWKAAAIINLVFGFILTIIATYIVYSVTKDLGSTALVFIIGLVVTGLMAALAAFACILEGFVLSALGFWGFLVAGSPYSAFSSGTIIEAIIASIFSTGIAVFLGGRVFSTKTLGLGKKPRALSRKSPRTPIHNGRNQIESWEKQTPAKVEVLPEKPSETDTSNYPEHALIVDRQKFLTSKNQVRKQLENLKKETAKGKINKETSKKLHEELTKELDAIDKDFAENLRLEIEDLKRESSDIETAIAQSNNQIAALEQEKSIYSVRREELEARFRIKQITRKEFKGKKKTYAQKIEQINLNIAQNNEKIQQLTRRQSTIREALKMTREELKHNRPRKSGIDDHG